MSFGVGFHKTILKMGKWRFGIGFRAKGATGAILLFFIAVMNLMWYMILGCLWLMYGVFYFVLVLPFKILFKIFKGRNTGSSTSRSFDKTTFSDEKEYLLEWQNIVCDNSSEALVMNKKQLKALTDQQAQNDLRIINDSKAIIASTVDPNTFFSRLNLLVEKAEHLCKLEKYTLFSGTSPSVAYEEVKSEYQVAIKQFLTRYFSDVFDKAELLKTQSGKNGRYKKFYDSLQPYYQYMDDNNIDFIETKYRAYVK